MRLSVIVPVHNGEATLAACLAAIAASPRPPDEIIVADDSSTDASATIAGVRGARVLPLPGGPFGPAVVRNRAAEAATGDVLVFVDADVTVHADALGRMEKYLTANPAVAALFGSYDDDPPARGLVTRYKNLLHHYVHQHGQREADTFWAGCAAIRRPVFLSVGGFREAYEKPSIEDVEMGGRLRRAGHSIRLCPEIQGTHLKRWTFASWIRTDIFARAVPWTHLILQNASLPSSLNLDWKGRAGAVCAWAAVFCGVLCFATPWAWPLFLAALGGLAAINFDLLRFFERRGGTGFAVGAFGLHWLYLLYSSFTYAAIAGPAKLMKHGLILLLLATLFRGLAWGVAVPPWQSWDEPQHFLYGQSVERMATLHVPPSLNLPQELWKSAELSQVDAVRFHPERPIDLSDRREIARTLSETGQESVKHSYLADPTRKALTEADFYRYHPPLYYAFLAAVQHPLEDRPIAVRLLACRLVSVLIGLGLVGLAWGLGRTLWPMQPGRALLLGTLVGFQPMAASTMATVTNSAPETLAFSALLLIGVWVIRDGMNAGYGLALGAITAVGLLIKISFLAALPLLGLLFVWDIIRRRRAERFGVRTLLPWTTVAVLPIALCAWWYRGTVQSGGSSLVTAYGKLRPRPPLPLWHYAATFHWGSVYSRVAASYWGAFGSVGDTHLPRVLQSLLIALAVITAGSVLRHLWQGRRLPDEAVRKRAFTLVFLGAATLCVACFYVAVDYRIAEQLGGHFGLRGQYYLPPLLGQMTWLLLGLEWLLPTRFRRVALWLLGTLMTALDFYALFGVILPRYYGTVHFVDQVALASVLQPVNALTIGSVCVLFLVSSLLLLIALAGSECYNGRNSIAEIPASSEN